MTAQPEYAADDTELALTPERRSVLADYADPLDLLRAWHVARGYALKIESLSITYDPAASG